MEKVEFTPENKSLIKKFIKKEFPDYKVKFRLGKHSGGRRRSDLSELYIYVSEAPIIEHNPEAQENFHVKVSEFIRSIMPYREWKSVIDQGSPDEWHRSCSNYRFIIYLHDPVTYKFTSTLWKQSLANIGD